MELVNSESKHISHSITQKHLPSLNGLRGISIILVVVTHLGLAQNTFLPKIFYSSLGVNTFFVLSGFLINTLCIREINLKGNLSLRSFYFRRILRIFPLSYLYIGVIFLINILCHLNIGSIQFVGTMFFITNIKYFRTHSLTWFFGHYWTLSIEEQFYIIFPFVLKNCKRVFIIAIVIIPFVLPILCTIQEYILGIKSGLFYGLTHYFVKFQSISIGCLFSILSFQKAFDYDFIRSTKIIGNIITFILLYYFGHDHYYSGKLIYFSLLVSILTGYILISNITESKDIIFKLLNSKLLSFIGVLSYSIYIWQQIFTSGDVGLSKLFVTYPTNLIFIIIVPIISYYCYERYFLRLKSRFSYLK